MNITHIVYHKNSFRVTQESLKVLRDTIVKKAHHKIAVVKVPKHTKLFITSYLPSTNSIFFGGNT